MTAIVQMSAFDQRIAPVEVKITCENPPTTTAKEIVAAAAKKFKSVTKSCRAYNGVTRLELTGEVSLDELKLAHVVLSGKAGWKGVAEPQEKSSSKMEVVDADETIVCVEKLECLDDVTTHDRLLIAAKSERSNGVVLLWKDTQDNGYLSNWGKSPIVLDGVAYNCVEQWIMANKARVCRDESVRQQIMSTPNPKKQKSLGRSLHRQTVARCWKVQQKWIVQLRGARAKFQQNSELAIRLLQTGSKPIAEASPSDDIFGIGLAPNNPLAQDPTNWNGLNLLGKALMQVRDELRSHLLSGGELSTFPTEDPAIGSNETMDDTMKQHTDIGMPSMSESGDDSSEEVAPQ